VTQGASLTRDEARPIAANPAKPPELRFSTTKPELRRRQRRTKPLFQDERAHWQARCTIARSFEN